MCPWWCAWINIVVVLLVCKSCWKIRRRLLSTAPIAMLLSSKKLLPRTGYWSRSINLFKLSRSMPLSLRIRWNRWKKWARSIWKPHFSPEIHAWSTHLFWDLKILISYFEIPPSWTMLQLLSHTLGSDQVRKEKTTFWPTLSDRKLSNWKR